MVLVPGRTEAVTSAAWAYRVRSYEVEPGASSTVPARSPLTNASYTPRAVEYRRARAVPGVVESARRRGGGGGAGGRRGGRRAGAGGGARGGCRGPGGRSADRPRG